MTIIDLKRIREGLPARTVVTVTRYDGKHYGKGVRCIECMIPGKPISEEDFETCKKWQRDIVGDALKEFYAEETGRHWFVYLKEPFEFINKDA